ncbi:MAG TPA: ROK family transcriptional regulator [Actinocrinis sp.]|uniref:ROK family transcriptional regulator n=1 Tax=Actinocrinis sp. TaxID=1920516 RepID=UPI002DDDAE5F|nr:ROK family transcriptional regulator [Actinocrinis sp.]HEV2347229.1 ROK family transcriptional regulator [Actinocrinis sp.]
MIRGGASATTEVPIGLTDLGRVRVLRALAENARLSRVEIASRTGLARATVASVVYDLINGGLVRESAAAGAASARAGRPPQILSLEPEAAFALGLDVAHDHVRAILTDVVGKIRWDRTEPMAVDDDPERTLAAAEDLIDTALRDSGVPRGKILGLGADFACPVDKDGHRLHAEGIMPGWVGIRPVDELVGRTGLPVRIINDANAGVLAERRYGAARGCDDVVYVRLSSGIGAGAICDGRMLLGHGAMAGELGHIIVEPRGKLCRCGNRGCLETVASPPAIAELLARSWGRPVGAADLAELLRSDDRGAMRAVEDAGEAIGRALAFVVMVLNPRLIVVGGDLAVAHEALFEPMHRAISRNTMTCHAESLRIVPSALGDNAGVRGAAALILERAPETLALAQGV